MFSRREGVWAETSPGRFPLLSLRRVPETPAWAGDPSAEGAHAPVLRLPRALATHARRPPLTSSPISSPISSCCVARLQYQHQRRKSYGQAGIFALGQRAGRGTQLCLQRPRTCESYQSANEITIERRAKPAHTFPQSDPMECEMISREPLLKGPGPVKKRVVAKLPTMGHEDVERGTVFH